MVNGYLEQRDWRVKECSNSSFSLQGLNNYISSNISQVYWLSKIYTPEIRNSHLSGAFHIHDLGLLSVYCQGWDLRDLLLSGFKGAPGKAESRPARHFRDCSGKSSTSSSPFRAKAAGAQAFSNFDTLLAPFICSDGLGYSEVKRTPGIWSLISMCPLASDSRRPSPTLPLIYNHPSYLANEPVIIGGQIQRETYAEFGAEMALFNRAFLDVLSEGDAKGRVFTFPIPTYNITRGFDWDNPALENLWTAGARLGIPYFGNFVGSEMSPDDARSMCCRLRLIFELHRRGGGLFGANPLTGSVGVVTINMPRIGFLASTEEDFLQQLDRLMDIARDSLETQAKVLEKFTEKDLYPYTTYYLRHVRERFGSYWHNHFATIGLVGMNEACLNLLGCDIGTPEGCGFAARVLDHMRDRLSSTKRKRATSTTWKPRRQRVQATD